MKLLEPLAAALATRHTDSGSPPTVKHLYSASVILAPNTAGLIPVPGGNQATLVVQSGTLSGGINATIKGGVGYPRIYENGTLTHMNVRIWGTTDDGVDFFIDELGIGSDKHRLLNRASFSIGGDYAEMSEWFIITVPETISETELAANGYVIC